MAEGCSTYREYHVPQSTLSVSVSLKSWLKVKVLEPKERRRWAFMRFGEDEVSKVIWSTQRTWSGI